MVTRSLFSRPLLLEHESLIKWEAPYYHNAYIHKYKIYQWDLYAIGYKYAADMAVEYGLKEYSLDINKYHSINRTVDVLVWPAIFLYRHYLELRLKAITIGGNMLELCEECEFPDEDDIQFRTKHELDELWHDCRIVIGNFHSEPDPEDSIELKTMDKYIEEFSKIDNKSYTFRYPVDKRDKKPWKYEKHQFSLINLKNIMDKIFLYLEDQNSSLDGALEYENECLREAYS